MKSLILSFVLGASLLGVMSATLPASTLAAECAEGEVKISVKIPGDSDRCIGGQGEDNNPILVYTRGIIKFLSGIFGLAIIIAIIVAGIQYITSQGYPDQVKNAKSRLTNAVVGLILFIL